MNTNEFFNFDSPRIKYAKWIKTNGGYKCPFCGNEMMDEWNYCPECGEKLEQADEN